MNRKEFEFNIKTIDLIINVVESHFELGPKQIYQKTKKSKVVMARKFIVYFSAMFTEISDTELATHLKIKNLSLVSYYRNKISWEMMLSEAKKMEANIIQSKIKSKILTDIAPQNKLIEIKQPIALRKSPTEAIIFSGLSDSQTQLLKDLFPSWSTVIYPTKITLQN